MLGALPFGKATTAIADFVFSAMGFTSTDVSATVGQSLQIDKVLMTGLSGAFEVDPTILLGSAHEAGIVTPANSGNPDVVTITSQWSNARVSLLKIVARPSGPLGTVSGTWGVGFIPYRSLDAIATMRQQVAQGGVTFEMVRQAPYNGFADANKPILLRKYFLPSDGHAYLPHTLLGSAATIEIGMIVIAYQDLMRGTYTDLKETDFQCTIDVSGTVILSDRLPLSPPTSYNNQAVPVPMPAAVVRHKKGLVTFRQDGTSCTAASGQCKVSGVVETVVNVQKPIALSMDSMAIE